MLATASLATRQNFEVETLAGTAPVSLFLLTVAASRERKSSCDGLASKPIHDWEGAEARDNLDSLRTYDFELAPTGT